MSELSELELEKKKLKYPIVFYYMTGCPHCEDAEKALDSEIKSGIIGPFKHTQNPPAGVQGFPHFVNNRNKKTFTGWPGSKEALYLKLDFVELFKEDYPEKYPKNTCYQDCWKKHRGPDGIQRWQSEMPTDSLFYARYYNCTERECDAAPKATQPVIPKVVQPSVGGVNDFKSRQSQECKECAVLALKCQNCALKCKKEGFSENFEMESVPSYPVVNHMETIPPDIHYYHHTGGGYSKLSNCWVKQPNFTA